MEDYVQ